MVGSLRSKGSPPPTWVAAVIVVLPEGLPVVLPSLVPIFEAMDEAATCRSCTTRSSTSPPTSPDTGTSGNPRHRLRPLPTRGGAQRLLAYVVLSGDARPVPQLEDRFAECSAEWASEVG